MTRAATPTCTRALTDRLHGHDRAPAESGHEKSAIIALVLTAMYTDNGGAPGSGPLEGASTRQLNPKTIQAEHYTGETGTQPNTGPRRGRPAVGFNDAGDWIFFEPVSLKGIDKLTVRYAAGGNGGIVDFRLGAPDGAVSAPPTWPTAAGTTSEVTIPLAAEGAHAAGLYLTYRARPGMRTTDLFDLDELRSSARASRPTRRRPPRRRPTVAGPAPLTVNFTGTGADPDGDTLTYAWDFTSDGTVDATTANASHTYTSRASTRPRSGSATASARAACSRHRGVPAARVVPRQRRVRGHRARPARWSACAVRTPFMNVAAAR